MQNVLVSIGLLTFMAFTFSGCSQEQDQPVPVLEADPANPPVASIELPCDIRFESSFGDVCFPHKQHLKLGCAKCHHEVQAEALNTPHPDYLESAGAQCQTCQNADQEGGRKDRMCSSCHHSEPENISDETLSSKVVLHKSCWTCHETGTGVEASAGCSKCHAKEEN